jgi:RNA polymerase sigma factor (sigma-70 family)
MVDSDYDLKQLTELRRGSQPAFWYFFGKYLSPLYLDIIDQCHDKESAKAVLIHVFAAVWQRRHIFRSEDQLKQYLFCAARIALNRMRNEAEHGHVNISDDFAGNELEMEADKTARARRPMIALDGLPGQQKRFIGKHHIEDKTVKDIAAAAALIEQTVTNHIYRGMKNLRKQLKKANKN